MSDVDRMRARLGWIDACWEKVVDEVVPRFALPERERRAEQAWRNRHNAKARRQQSGKRRDGRASGASSAHKLVVLPTCTVEARAATEKRLLQLLEDKAGDPELDAIAALLKEGEALREALAAVDDARMDF